MTDEFSGYNAGLDSPGLHHFAITPNDSTDLAIKPRALYVGTLGDVEIIDEGGTTVVYKSVSGWLPFRAVRVKAANTSATDIVGVY